MKDELWSDADSMKYIYNTKLIQFLEVLLLCLLHMIYSTVYNATATSTVLYVADDMNELLLLVLLYADVMWVIRVYTVSKVLADFAVFD